MLIRLISKKRQVKNRSPPRGKNLGSELEARLNQKPNLGTDIMDFLLIAGMSYFWSPLYRQADRELQEVLYEKYLVRRINLSHNQEVMETIFVCTLASPYLKGKVKTIGDLKEIIERKELLSYSNSFMKGLAAFNKILREYGLEDIKAGGVY